MSQTIIEKLLKGAEVEWKPLWKVTIWDKKFNGVEHFKQPKTIKYHYLLASELKALAIPNGSIKLLTTSTTNYWTSEKLAKNKINNGEIVAIPWGGDINVQYYNGKFITADNRILTSVDKEFLDNKYLYYFFNNNYRLLKSFYRGSGIKHPNMAGILDILIPIPPLSVQQEIVRILDAFTAHTAELTAELNERKKQYNYYRDKLLTFSDDEVEWKPLGEVGELIRGNGLQKKDLIESGVPAIHYGQIYTYYGLYTETTKSYVSSLLAKKLKKINCGDLVITNTSENIEDVLKPLVYLGNIPAVIGGHASIFKPRNYINGKYIAYLFNTNFFFKQKEKIARGTKVIEISLRDLSRIVLPIPSLERQKRIVSILDKFDALTTSISEGLPREIELRNKQYEYYRDQLLNFPQPENDAIKHNSTNR
ncbi:restriction endonuclease subunit S [Bartonella apis]|uniref:restriction endonuclease subunit S n=1 Tax=Bartonella apis TaxID=1686310 RepID=UPI0018DE36A0|nr:restriction endonuclease subunit S [Bartonella apis]MBI0177247.1 restriction endonuclease subunit S [Bartonella apis]